MRKAWTLARLNHELLELFLPSFKSSMHGFLEAGYYQLLSFELWARRSRNGWKYHIVINMLSYVTFVPYQFNFHQTCNEWCIGSKRPLK